MRLTFLFIACLTLASNSYGQNYKKKYKDQIEPDSKIIEAGANYTIEKTKDKTFVYKQYYPETKMITKVVSSKSKKFTKADGLQQVSYDDGTIVSKGICVDGKKEGIWIEKSIHEGQYKNGLKHGIWKVHDAQNNPSETIEYLDGLINGKRIVFDSSGLIRYEEIYENDKLISSTYDSTVVKESDGQMPRFAGCENQNLKDKQLTKCANQKLLEYIYSNLKYPKKSRKEKIEGTAIIQFVVDSTGQISDIKPLSGLSREIESHCIDIISKMPNWVPGIQDNKPVNALYTIPIRFKLN